MAAVKQQPLIASILNFSKLSNDENNYSIAAQGMQSLLSRVIEDDQGLEDVRIDKRYVESLIDELDEKLSKQMDEILHNAEFQALEDLKRKRAELESWCRLYAPSGTWDRWQFFQAEARKARRAAQKQKEKERQELIEAIMYAFSGLFALGGAGAVVFFIGRYMEKW